MYKKKVMIAMRKAGYTYEEIGNAYSLSRQRVHQLIGSIERPLKDRPERRRLRRKRMREQVIEILGGVCSKCGFSDARALQVDHVNGNGAEERKTLRSYGVYKKIVLGDTEGYQLLCANCNWIKRYEQEKL